MVTILVFNPHPHNIENSVRDCQIIIPIHFQFIFISSFNEKLFHTGIHIFILSESCIKYRESVIVNSYESVKNVLKLVRKMVILFFLQKEWVSDCSLLCQLSNFSAISWWEQVIFNENDDNVRFVLDQHAELNFNSASSLKQQSAVKHVAPLGHIILIPSQPVFALTL